MGIRRSMTGVSWHIEKTGGYSKTRVNCFNCVYLNGHWCERNRIQVTNNNAPVCRAYKNMYVTKKDSNKKSETIFYKGIMPSETGFRFSSGL